MHIQMPQEMTISQIANIHALLREQLATSEGAVFLDGSIVIEIDGAGLQLLMAVARALQTSGRGIAICSPSSAMVKAFSTVGWEPPGDRTTHRDGQ